MSAKIMSYKDADLKFVSGRHDYDAVAALVPKPAGKKKKNKHTPSKAEMDLISFSHSLQTEKPLDFESDESSEPELEKAMEINEQNMNKVMEEFYTQECEPGVAADLKVENNKEKGLLHRLLSNYERMYDNMSTFIVEFENNKDHEIEQLQVLLNV